MELATDCHAVQVREPWSRRLRSTSPGRSRSSTSCSSRSRSATTTRTATPSFGGTRSPIAGGECLTGVDEFRDWLDKGALDYVQPDATHVGGVGVTRDVARLAEERHVGLIVHTGAAIGPGFMANLHVAFASPNARFVEYAVAPDNVRAELLAEPVVLVGRLPGPPDGARARRRAAGGLRGRYPYRPGHRGVRVRV